jgi:delta 1-pyrroline-5-carboxylate dehydrogenase
VEPTLFTDVDNSMTIAQEEIFGPVLVVIPFDDDDDAVQIANDSVYGLSGGVFSGSLERSLAVAERIRTGTFASTVACRSGQADMPFGGYKHSGIGRQNGVAGFDQYLETKSVAWPTPLPRPVGPQKNRAETRRERPRTPSSAGTRLSPAPDQAVVRETDDASSFVLDVPDELAETFRYRPGSSAPSESRRRDDEQLRSYSMSSAPETDTT